MKIDSRPLTLLVVLGAACGHTAAKPETAGTAAFGLTASQRARIHVTPIGAVAFRPTV